MQSPRSARRCIQQATAISCRQPDVHIELADFQDQMLAALLGPDSGRGDDVPLSAIALRVHRNTIHSAVADALAANFPAVAEALGAEDFLAAAGDFVRRQPPTDPRLLTYGSGFPAFLAQAGAAEAAALARLDLAWIEAYSAAATEALRAIDPAQLSTIRVAPHPATRYAAAGPSLIQRWSAMRGIPLTIATAETDHFLLLSRPEGVVLATPCDGGLACMLGLLHSEPRLLDAAMAACDAHPEFDVGTGFRRLLTAGALVAASSTGVNP
jgi:hypothetical protein